MSKGKRQERRLESTEVFALRKVTKKFRASPFSRTSVTALHEVSLDIQPKESFGILGETGSGKTTLARLLCRLTPPTSGDLLYRGKPLEEWEERRFRTEVQMVLQDPFSSLNPNQRVEEILLEPLRYLKGGDRADPAHALQQVGLEKDVCQKFPFELSGGQRQRVAIARAISLEPKVLIADEPVSMLDMSLRSSILHLLRSLKEKLSLTLIVISHDISIFPFLCDRIAVLYSGKLLELAPESELFARPLHPYTELLFLAAPQFQGNSLERVLDRLPRHRPHSDSKETTSPCPFYPRCALSQKSCETTVYYAQKESHLLYCPPRAKEFDFPLLGESVTLPT